MNRNGRNSPYWLNLAAVAVLAAAGIYIVMQDFKLPLQISLGLIVIGLATFTIQNPESARRFITASKPVTAATSSFFPSR